jgi:hypothetical protein
MRYCLLLLFVLSSYTCFSEESIHALLACDTFSDLRSSTKKDIAHLKTALREIAAHTGLRLSTHMLYGDTLTSKNVYAWAKKAQTLRADVLVFYYSGHGLRSHSQWPMLMFPSRKESFPSEKLYENLKTLHSRLIIILLDCCNNSPPSAYPPIFLATPKQAQVQKKHLPGLKPLFLKTQGIIMAVGASPGEAAYAFDNGSVFTNSFIKALKKKALIKHITWKGIFDEALHICSPMQTPVSYLQISSIAPKKSLSPKSKRKPRG